jgi:hypothetical protein
MDDFPVAADEFPAAADGLPVAADGFPLFQFECPPETHQVCVYQYHHIGSSRPNSLLSSNINITY